jgi:hypothetical protein
MHRDYIIVHIAQPEVGGVLSRAAGLIFMPNKRGNPNWGHPMLPAAVLCTEFEMQVRHLHLAPEDYVASSRLRRWCEEKQFAGASARLSKFSNFIGRRIALLKKLCL